MAVRPCKYKLLFACIMLYNISLGTSVSLNLTELRNKVAKLKVHPRGNLWATGHFMGKKSISNSQLQDHLSPECKRSNTEVSDEVTEGLRELVTQAVLKVALQAELKGRTETQDAYEQDTDFLTKLLKNFTNKNNIVG